MLTKDSSPEMGQTALFLDVDNFMRFGKNGRDFEIFMRALLHSWGKISIRRAYGNSLAFRPQISSQLRRYHFLFTSSTESISYKKNGADIRIAVEAMEIVHTRPEIQSFIIASGDSDFIALVENLHQYQKIAIGIGSINSISSKLLESFDTFLYYENILERESAEKECFVFCKITAQQMKNVLLKRGLYPPGPHLRRQMLGSLDKLRKESPDLSFNELQEKMIALCLSKGIKSRVVRNFFKGLVRTNLIVKDCDLPRTERQVLPLPTSLQLEEAMCSCFLEVLLDEWNLIIDPIALSQVIWGDTKHVQQVKDRIEQKYPGQKREKGIRKFLRNLFRKILNFFDSCFGLRARNKVSI